MKNDIRYGVIGTGMMGIEHIENINAIDGAVVTAVSDPDVGSLSHGQKAARLDEEAAFSGHKGLLASGLVDAVVVASPNYTHAEILHDVIDSARQWMTHSQSLMRQGDTKRLPGWVSSTGTNPRLRG